MGRVEVREDGGDGYYVTTGGGGVEDVREEGVKEVESAVEVCV